MAKNFKSKIGGIEKRLMLGTALFFDLCSIIPFLNIVFDILAWLVFTLWFLANGVPPRASYKIVSTAILSFVVGFIPIVSALPELTASIFIIITIFQLEEKKMHKEKEAAEEQAMAQYAAAQQSDEDDEQVEMVPPPPPREPPIQYRVNGNMIEEEQDAPRTKTMSLDGTTEIPVAVTKQFSESIRRLDEMIQDQKDAFAPRNTLSFGNINERNRPIGTNLRTVYDAKGPEKKKINPSFVSGNEPTFTTSGKNLKSIGHGGIRGSKSIGGFTPKQDPTAQRTRPGQTTNEKNAGTTLVDAGIIAHTARAAGLKAKQQRVSGMISAVADAAEASHLADTQNENSKDDNELGLAA